MDLLTFHADRVDVERRWRKKKSRVRRGGEKRRYVEYWLRKNWNGLTAEPGFDCGTSSYFVRRSFGYFQAGRWIRFDALTVNDGVVAMFCPPETQEIYGYVTDADGHRVYRKVRDLVTEKSRCLRNVPDKNAVKTLERRQTRHREKQQLKDELGELSSQRTYPWSTEYAPWYQKKMREEAARKREQERRLQLRRRWSMGDLDDEEIAHLPQAERDFLGIPRGWRPERERRRVTTPSASMTLREALDQLRTGRQRPNAESPGRRHRQQPQFEVARRQLPRTSSSPRLQQRPDATTVKVHLFLCGFNSVKL